VLKAHLPLIPSHDPTLNALLKPLAPFLFAAAITALIQFTQDVFEWRHRWLLWWRLGLVATLWAWAVAPFVPMIPPSSSPLSAGYAVFAPSLFWVLLSALLALYHRFTYANPILASFFLPALGVGHWLGARSRPPEISRLLLADTVLGLSLLIQFAILLRVASERAWVSHERAWSREITPAQNERLSALLRVIVHDLGNQVQRLRFGVSMLKKDGTTHPDIPLNDALDRILRACVKQREIIDHVREMRQLENTDPKLFQQPVSLTGCVAEAIDTFQESLHEKSLTLTQPAAAPSGVMVLAERVTLTHSVISNLLSNAIKFTPKGRQIHLEYQPGSPSSATITLTLRDEGIGIPPPLREVLFDPAAPTSRPGTEGETGTGFGMPLVKKYMDLYGGSIRVDSPATGGTSVELTFRVAKEILA
jgi:signal transduction histidine kinase